VKLDWEAVEELFRVSEHQADVLFGLYRMVYPNWDDIAKVEGFPKISDTTNTKLFQKFIEFDRVHHPEVFAGGCWMNNGFSGEKDIAEWHVEPCEVTLK
jgi:hypothetical protein